MKILLMSCGGTIVSPVEEDVHRAGKTATEGAVAEFLDELYSQNMGKALWANACDEAAILLQAGRFKFATTPVLDGPLKSLRVNLPSKVPDSLNRLYQTTMPPDQAPKKHLEPGDLLHLIPEVVPLHLLDKDSTLIGPDDWKYIGETIIDNYDSYDAFVILHGTNSLAYTACALGFGLPALGKPVIITGSNSPRGVPNSDAAMNATNAHLVAQKMFIEGKYGVFVVFGTKIIPGVRAKKANGTELEAFRTFNAPDVGKIGSKGISIDPLQYKRYLPRLGQKWPDMKPAGSAKDLREHARMDFNAIISSHTFHPGDMPETYMAVLDSVSPKNSFRKAQSLPAAFIIRAVGDGDLPETLNAFLREAKHRKIPVVVTTQEPQGTSSLRFNEISEGAEDQLRLIPAWDMSIEAMVIKLRYLLGGGASYETVHEEFKRNFLGEIKISSDEVLEINL